LASQEQWEQQGQVLVTVVAEAVAASAGANQG
jgi:hypothetical protein